MVSKERKPGWYVTDEDGRRYWDGVAWHDSKPDRKRERQVFVFGKIVVSKSNLILVSAIVLALLGGGVIAGTVAAEQQRLAEVAAANEAERAAEVAQAEAEKRAAEELAEAEEAERALRAEFLAEVQATIKGEARKAQKNGWLAGSKIIDVSCTPLSGSMDDLLAASTDFECFAAYKANKDGTQSGWFWDVTVNWDTGSYTWEMR